MAYRGTRRSKLNPILFSIAALLAIAWWLAGMPLATAEEAWKAGDHESALESLDRGARFRLRPADYDHLYAAVYLSKGDATAAAPHLQALAGKDADWFAPIGKHEVGERLIRRGYYREFLDYDTKVNEKRSDPSLTLYRAAALIGTGDVERARSTFDTIDSGEVDSEAYQALRRAIEQRAAGDIPLVLARNGETIATWQVENEDLVAVNSNFQLLVDELGGATSIEANLDSIDETRTIVSTLDPALQAAALAALGSRRGAIVVIDPATHEILAAASSPGAGEPRNIAFGGSYEPGSVIKALTQMHAIDDQVDLDTIFPLTCNGFIVLDGRQFFDWARHGEVAGPDEAMAVSCNVAYGRMGLELGTENIEEFMQRAGFGSGTNLGLYSVGLGTIIGDPLTDYQTANLGIGLAHYRTNALHLAMLADAIANGGVLSQPTMVRHFLTVLNEEIEPEPRVEGVRIASEQATERTIDSMEAVLTSERGTGRRARIPGLDYAIKTGTAGDRPYEAVIIGIIPAENPRYAFAIIGEDVGPAEYEGAAMTKVLVERIRARMNEGE